MKKYVIFGILFVILLIAGCSIKNSYNDLVEKEEGVKAKWSEVENQYQRRMDLIPNLVETVKGYAQHEQETLQGVIEARAHASQITIDPTNATPEQLAAYQQSQGQLSQTLGRLMMLQEHYPELKANENFKALQDQLEGTENRITYARGEFNKKAEEYNTEIRRFPKNLYASWFGFKEKPYFEAEKGAEKAPTVQF